jgi:hypothetical protein
MDIKSLPSNLNDYRLLMTTTALNTRKEYHLKVMVIGLMIV